MLEEGTKRTNRKRAPARTAGGRALGRGASGRVFGRTFRGGAAGGAMGRGARPTGVFCGGDGRGVAAIRRALWRPAAGLRRAQRARRERWAQRQARQAGRWCAACGVRLTGLFSWRGGAVRTAWRLAQAFFATRQTGRWCAACGVRLTGLFSRRGGARCGCHTARALAVRGRPAAWRGVWLARLFCGGAAGGAMGARRGGARFSHGGWGCRPVPAARRGRAGKTKTA